MITIPIFEFSNPLFISLIRESPSSIWFWSYQILDIPEFSKHLMKGSTIFSMSSLACDRKIPVHGCSVIYKLF